MRLLFRIVFLCCLYQVGMMQGLAAPRDPVGRLPFQSYGREAGLVSLRINLLLQDKVGFIWVGTDNGLSRFDGHRFQTFGLEHGLPSLEVNAMQLDSNGDMWVGTRAGLARWTGDHFVKTFEGFPDGLSVEEIILGPSQELLLGTREGIYRGGALGFKAIKDWKGGPVNTLAMGPDGATLWVGAKHDLWTWRAESGWKIFPNGPVNGRNEELDRLFTAPDGRLWARTSRATYALDPGKNDFEVVSELSEVDTYLSRFQLGPDGAVWIPTTKGIYRYQHGRFSHIGLKDGLPTDFARAVLIDREGNLWCGSLGLHRQLGRGAWRAHTPKEGLPANVWALMRDRSKNLWVGTENGLAQSNGDTWSIIPGTEPYLVRSIVQPADGSFLFGGEPFALMRYDTTTKKLQEVPIGFDVGGRKIMSLALDKTGRLWLGTQKAGMLVGVNRNGAWGFEKIVPPGTKKNDRISSIRVDRQGGVWITSSSGLLFYKDENWQLYDTKHGLLSNDVLYVNEGSDGDMWLIYRDKPGVVSRFQLVNGQGKVVQSIGESRLKKRDIYLVGEDSQGRLWVGSDQGVDLLASPRALQGVDAHFGVEDGLVDEELNAMTFLAGENGNVWFGTHGGLVHFESAKFPGEPPPPTVAILKATIGQHLFTASGGDVQVDYRQNTYEVAFAGLSYLDAASVQIETRLLGLEDEWYASLTREARYPSLRPGTYTMEIRARFRKGAWGAVSSQTFTILPPWWQTWWFRTLMVVAVIASIYLFERRRVNLLKRQAKVLEDLVAVRTEELAFANNALRDQSLTDPLTGLRNRRYLTEVIPDHIDLANRSNSVEALSGVDRSTLCNDLIFVMIDIDYFKFINDTFGHPAGDKVLSQVGQILKECTRESDTVARWGGEEFIVVAHQTCQREVSVMLERIRLRFETHAFDLGNGQTINRTCSMGFAFYPFFASKPHHVSWKQLVELADRCLYVAKRSGRNAWVGLYPKQDCDTDEINDISERIAQDMASMKSLIIEGKLEVQTSLSDPDQLRWDS